MIEYTTIDDLKRFNREMIAEDRQTIVKKAETASVSGSTFLSHSTKDIEHLPGVLNLLRSHGASVYIDKKDEQLPPFTSRETAIVLKKRIAECQKFILFATKASKDSRWVPWELGISDGLKKSRNTAILPAVDNQSDKDWSEREYLGVYDRIIWGDHDKYTRKIWMVYNHETNTATELSAWLKRP